MAGISRSKDLNDLIKRAVKQGWTVTLLRSNHIEWKGPKGGIVYTGSSPSDFRVVKNTIRELRKHGFLS